ncbi:MAG: YraN family protein [Clostridia bacterium]|nr:YraN family protein [Clostridia bacterium]
MRTTGRSGVKNKLGERGEKYARRWLFFHGYRIIGKNVEMRRGELDIIATRGEYIVFVEVKTRTDDESLAFYGRPARAVNREKKLHIVAAVKEYLYRYPSDKQPRIDIIEVYVDPVKPRKHRIVQIKSAFGADAK